MHPTENKAESKIDIREHGAPRDGVIQVTDRRMYFQLQVFTECHELDVCIEEIEESGLDAVVYKDANDPYGIGILWMAEDPEVFVAKAREVMSTDTFTRLIRRPELTMMGRTYSNGRETQLEDWLLNKFRKNCLNPDLKWVVWYPLRRKASFALLSAEEQGKMLMEHAVIGRTYGMADLAHDVRLSCYGIDQNDNEFVIGLVGKELYPLSRIVQDMRKTQQTANYIESLGPFFVGRVAWQAPYKDIPVV